MPCQEEKKNDWRQSLEKAKLIIHIFEHVYPLNLYSCTVTVHSPSSVSINIVSCHELKVLSFFLLEKKHADKVGLYLENFILNSQLTL